MNDMLKLRMPIKASHVDVDSEGRHCIFGFNLLDLDLPRVEARCVFKDDEGNVVNQVLNHPYDRLPTSFTKMAWKFHHEGKLWPHVELKASPAKILQGHNVYGTDWITKPQEKKDESKTTTDKPASGAIPTTEQKNPQNVQNQNEVAASSPVVDSASSAVPAYDVSDPFAFEPVTAPNVVNHRVFSGCFCQKNSCKAYDQQGTIIKNVSPQLCKGLIKDSSNRPFNYFEKPQQPNATNTNTSPILANTSQPQQNQSNTNISISMSREDLAKYEQAKKEGLI